MATYVDILKSEFPELDTEVFAYITGESCEIREKTFSSRSCAETVNYKVYIALESR